MKVVLMMFLLCAACSSQQQKTERSVPQCLSLCSNQFAACTEEFPGDASACLPGRRDCERTCESERALQRGEGNKPGEVMAPMDKPQIIRPDAGTQTPDSAQIGD